MVFIKLTVIFAFISSVFSAGIGIVPHISDGTETDIKEFPFMVSIQMSTLQICQGTLISNKHVVSSGRCMSNRYLPQVVVEWGNTVISPGVRDGPHNVGVNQLIFHPNFNYSTYENDICILELKQEINLDSLYEPLAHLATPGSRFAPGTIATHAGWGYTSANETTNQLYRANVRVISQAECETAVGDTKQPFFQNICALEESVLCSGDMGAPLLINRVLVGIGSFRNGELCTNVPGQFPNVYTAVSFYIGWIETVTGIRFNVNTFMSRN